MNPELELTPVEFVALLNQTLEYAYPTVTVQGELANFRVSKNRWVYFDLKDDEATVRFFGSVYQLSGPLEDGMMVKVRGQPRLHPQFGFSVTMQSITPVGEGSIKKAASLLQAQLQAEGLFDPLRKRALPYPPSRIGLITSAESAAYRDFVKVLGARWGGLEIAFVDVQVQGESAPAQIVQALAQLNQLPEPPEIIVVTRGGGSAEDLQAFSTEQVTRAVAGSRIPTLVAIGHEVDVSLAELAADRRASTPSNAAELLTPDREDIVSRLAERRAQLGLLVEGQVSAQRSSLVAFRESLTRHTDLHLHHANRQLTAQAQLLQAFNPQVALRRGYAIVRKDTAVIRSGRQLAVNDRLHLELVDAELQVGVQQVKMKGTS